MAETRSMYDELLSAMPEMAHAVNAFDSESTKRDALRALLAAKLGQTVVVEAEEQQKGEKEPSPARSQARRGAKAGRSAARQKRRVSPSALGDLELRPNGKQAFSDFAAEKAPANMQEQSTVAIYYLQHVLGESNITENHVITCFQDMKWKKPANLTNHLQVLSSKKSWIDTSDMGDIQCTTRGENLVEHDLPKASKEG